jgi:LmbE family N-acetylglucosaminyl deacetylase
MNGGRVHGPAGSPGTPGCGGRPGQHLPAWETLLAVVAHPDDETFGLGAIIGAMTAGGAGVHILCYTRGEASTLNENRSELFRQRADELRQASAALGATTVALLDYPDGHLAAQPPRQLATHVTGLISRHHPGGLLVFDDTGITGHPDHRAATAAAVLAGRMTGLPVLAWALPAVVADQLRAETRNPFAGQPPGRVDLCVPVDRASQRQAAWLHASQISASSVLWRRLELQGDREHLRWLLPPADPAPEPGAIA